VSIFFFGVIACCFDSLSSAADGELDDASWANTGKSHCPYGSRCDTGARIRSHIRIPILFHCAARYAAVTAAEDAICAELQMAVQFLFPTFNAFSGTTTVSLGATPS